MDFWTIIFVVASLFVIILIILWITESFAVPLSPINPICIADVDCPGGRRCENGACKSPVGGTCSTLADCVNSAIVCQNGICLAEPRNDVGQPCPCHQGLICQNGFCHAPIGATCLQNRDCVSGSLCIMGHCAIAPTGMTGATACDCSHDNDQTRDTSYQEHYTPYTQQYDRDTSYTQQYDRDTSYTQQYDTDTSYPQQHDGSYPQQYTKNTSSSSSSNEEEIREPFHIGACLTSHECQSGYFCSPRCVYRGYNNSKMLPVISKQYLHGENALDMTVYRDQLYILLEGGDILRVTDHIPIRIESSIPLEKIFSFTGRLYGLYNTAVYSLVDDQLDTTTWSWEVIPELDEFIDVSVTLDQQHIWLETRQHGYLYDTQWRLVDKVKRKGCLKRIYGPTKDIWVDIYPNYSITSGGERYSHLKTCCFEPSGRIFLPKNKDISLIHVLPYQGEYVPFFILERNCIPI